jgi:hypothetical protein
MRRCRRGRSVLDMERELWPLRHEATLPGAIDAGRRQEPAERHTLRCDAVFYTDTAETGRKVKHHQLRPIRPNARISANASPETSASCDRPSDAHRDGPLVGDH